MTLDAQQDKDRPRFYGTDETDDLEALTEVKVLEDGTVEATTVIIEKDAVDE